MNYSKFINCYLITSLSDLQWREWTLHDLSLLLVSAMQATPTPAASFTLAFKYFDKSGGVNPMSSWMTFHEEFLCRSDYEECARALSEFNLARDKVRVCGRVCVCGRGGCVGGRGGVGRPQREFTQVQERECLFVSSVGSANLALIATCMF